MKRNKYGAKRTTVDGQTFDSKAEADRWMVLRLRQTIGEVKTIIRQPRFDLIVSGQPCGFYKADFSYLERGPYNAWIKVVEDVKGRDTPVSALKRKLVLALYGVRVRCVDANGKEISTGRKKRAAPVRKKKGRSRVNEIGQSAAT